MFSHLNTGNLLWLEPPDQHFWHGTITDRQDQDQEHEQEQEQVPGRVEEVFFQNTGDLLWLELGDNV